MGMCLIALLLLSFMTNKVEYILQLCHMTLCKQSGTPDLRVANGQSNAKEEVTESHSPVNAIFGRRKQNRI